MGIFENFDKLELEEMRFEVALFQAISISNYAREVKTFAQNKGTKLINSVSGLISSRSLEEKQVETVEDLVAEKCEEMKASDRLELHEEMVKQVKDRLLSLGVDPTYLTSEDRIAYYAVQEAEKNISKGIGPDASAAQKADDVAALFAKKQIKELKGNITQKRQDRDLLAHFIWKVSVHNEPYFPHALEEAEGEASLSEDLRRILTQKTDDAQKEKENSIAMENAKNRIAGDKSNISDLESKMVFVDKRIAEYEEKGEADSADAESAKRVKEITEAEIKAKKEELAKNEAKLAELGAEQQKISEGKKQKETEEKELIQKISGLLQKKWAQSLIGIVISADAIEHLVRIYSAGDRKALESALLELGRSRCPEAISTPDAKGENHIFSFVISKTAVGRIVFRDENGVIEVSSILKVKRA